jgi:hypothetical protein
MGSRFLAGALRLAVFVFVLFAATPAWSQNTSTATVTGQVTDQQGAAIPAATVQMADPSTNTTLSTTTNDVGRYVFVNVPSGTYSMTFSKDGFSTYRVSNTAVTVGAAITVNAKLNVGSTTTTVEVTATAGAELQTTSAAVGTTISGTQLQALPNMGREASTLAVLQPGVALDGSTAGAVRDQNTFQLDGGNNTDDMAGTTNGYGTNFNGLGGVQTNGSPSGVIPTPVESIEEFRVSGFNQTADFNGSAGSQIQMVTKRGTNQWHGSAYGYYFATNLGAANTWVANHTPATINGVHYPYTPLPSNHRDRFGGSLGGPLTPKFWGGKTYFFFNYEGFRFPNVSTYERRVPSDLLKLGVIQIPNSSGQYVGYNLNPGPVTYNGVTYQPSGLDPRNIGISPVIQRIWNTQMPEGNDPIFSGADGYNTLGYLSTIRAPLATNNYVARIDHDFSEKLRFFGTYRFTRLVNVTTNQVDIGGALPGDTLGQPKARAPRDQVPSYWVAGLTANVSPNLTNDFRYNYTRNFWQWGSSNDPAQFAGLGGAVEIGGETATALIPYNVNNQSTRQRFWDGKDNLIRDDVTWIHGKHLVQFGFSYQRNDDYHMRTDNGGTINNQIVYQVNSSGIDFSSFPYPGAVPSSQHTNFNNYYSYVLGLVNLPQVAQVRAGKDLHLLPVGSEAFEHSIIPFYDWYLSDTWHMSSSFTLTLGLGYVIEMPPYELNQNQAIPVDQADQPLSVQDYLAAKKNAALRGQVYDPIVGYATNGNVGSGLKYPYNPRYGDFSPRVAAAWNPQASSGLMGTLLGQGRTVIRAGYGRIYGRLNGVELLLLPLLGIGPIQPITCPGASRTGQCLGSGGVTPATAFRIGPDGLTAPLASVPPQLPQPDFPGSLPGGNDAAAGDLMSLDRNFQPNRTDNVTVSIQRQVTSKSTLEVGYIGRMIRHESTMTNLDAVPYMLTLNGQQFSQAYSTVYKEYCGLGASCLQNAAAVTTQPWFESALGGANSPFCAGYSSCTAAVIANKSMAGYIAQSSVSDLWIQMAGANGWTLGRTNISSNPRQMTALGLADAVGYGNYNALFMTFQTRDWHGLTALSNFTWGHSLGIGAFTQSSGTFTILDPYNIGNNYGPNPFDIRVTYNLAISYSPTWYASQKGLLGHVLGGWTIAPLYTAQTAGPVGIYDSNQGSCGNSSGGCAFGEVAAGGVSSFGPATYGTENAVAITPVSTSTTAHYNNSGSGGIGTNNSSAVNLFANPAAVYNSFRPCTLGIDQSCSGYANFRGLPQWNLDVSLTKDVAVWKERVGAQFIFLFTNVTNHVVMGVPSASLDLGNPTAFGRLNTQANIPRNMEFGLRIHF